MTTVLLFLSLGLDTLAVALGLGLAGLPRTRWLQVGLTFALFEGGMPIVGLLIGQGLSQTLGQVATYLAAGLLIVVGLLAIREALQDADDAAPAPAMQGRTLLLTGFSVSLDELAVGFSLGVLHVPVSLALGYIALQAFVLTFLGLRLGRGLGARLGERAELVSGLVLILLGVALVVGEVTGTPFL